MDKVLEPIGEGTILLTEKEVRDITLIDNINRIWTRVIAANITGITEPEEPVTTEEDIDRIFTGEYRDHYGKALATSEDWTAMFQNISGEMEEYEGELVNFP